MRHVALFAIIAVATAGCGGSDASSVTTAAPTTASTAVPTTVASEPTEPTEPPTTVAPTTTPAPGGFYTWDGAGWSANGDLPPCPDDLTGFFPVSPVDVARATAVLAPGQSRGGNYKPHGGFRFDGSANDDIVVVVPADATLWSAARYVEAGEVQYLLQFRTPCGIMFRFDHLRVLSPAVQAAIEEVPEAADGSSRTTFLSSPFEMQAGDTVATSVGFIGNGNTSMDFGVYDPRQQNQASLDPAFPEQQFRELAWYAVCWYSMLPADAAAMVDQLPGGDGVAGRASDYCPS